MVGERFDWLEREGERETERERKGGREGGREGEGEISKFPILSSAWKRS